MKRTQDKIKDFVEVAKVEELRDFTADPARTLTAYRFTDTTADLVARWLDTLADLPRGRGAARALAGVRGVGKSHTLAVFGALAAYPNLRPLVTDAHVATCARRLMNRRYVLVRVRRGTRQTLWEEMAAALAETFGGDESRWGSEPEAIVTAACAQAAEATLLFLIDTAAERERRVGRNDGPFLSRMARAAESANAFLALALDDDIADASGANATLAGTFQIDYLDPEHLYRIAEAHVLRKTPQARVALHELYLNLRAFLPSFRWSEPRFTALYPLHPLIADIAASVRLYAQGFAFLPFAAQSAQRAANRPALSLVLVDEVFDHAERALRQAEELREAIAAYDELVRQINSQFPVMQRLEAKLALKALFILSLEGSGVTPSELCAALLLYDEAQPEAAPTRLSAILERFAAAVELDRRRDGHEVRYRLRIDAARGFEEALGAAADSIPDAVVKRFWRNIARRRFADWPIEDEASSTAGFHFVWRGTRRPGRVFWVEEDPTNMPTDSASDDWHFSIFAPGTLDHPISSQERAVAARWLPSEPRADEVEVIRRLAALHTHEPLTAEFGDAARAALASLSAQAERIWTRLYLDEGRIAVGAIERALSEEARAASSLAEILQEALGERFAEVYPQHPTFAEILEEEAAARLIEGIFGGFDPNDAEVQRLAQAFAVPLGLVVKRGDSLTLSMGDEMFASAWTREILHLIEKANGAMVPIEEVRSALRHPPFGLLPEAQKLIIAALVGSRRIELVTVNEDRITRRTLDRTLRWDEIKGVVRAASITHSAEELTAWARMLTGDGSLTPIVEQTARLRVRDALAVWFDRWQREGCLKKLTSLPDQALSTRLWNMIACVRRSFGSVAEIVEAAINDQIPLEEGLQRIADCFADDMHRFVRARRYLEHLMRFADGLDRWRWMRAYLCEAESTGIAEIEDLRLDLLAMTEDLFALAEEGEAERLESLWRRYHGEYIAHYLAAHAIACERVNEQLEEFLRSDAWREFENLRPLSSIGIWAAEEAARLLRRFGARRICRWSPEQALSVQPRCYCGFRLREKGEFARALQEMRDLVALGRTAYRQAVAALAHNLVEALNLLAQSDPDERTSKRARRLADMIALGGTPEWFERDDVLLIERALQMGATASPVSLSLPTEIFGLITHDELRTRLEHWLDALPHAATLIEIRASP